ncbi:MAG: DUF6763 family protein [Pseudomonadota bacterium]
MAQWLREFSIGDWYVIEDQSFEIVGIDVKAEIVLVQYYDGALDEIDFESWGELNAQPTAPPENLSGALDADSEDFGLIDDHSGPRQDANPSQWLEAHGL